MRFLAGAIFGGVLSWFFVADHYGHILTHSKMAGIFCRVHGLDTVRVTNEDFLERKYLCIDLSGATQEQALVDQFWEQMAWPR